MTPGNLGPDAVIFDSVRTKISADGKVSPAEWRSFQESLGNGEAAKSSFQHVDTDHNGYLTVEELLDAIHEYLADPDARGGWFFGDV